MKEKFEISISDVISALEDMWQDDDKTKVLDWIKYAVFQYEQDKGGSATLEDKMQDLYLALCYVRNNFNPEVLQSVLSTEMMGDEIIHAAMLYLSGKSNREVNDMIGEDRLVGGYLPTSPDEKESLSVIRILGQDCIYLVENETSDNIFDGVHRAGALHLLSGVGIEKVLMQPKLCGLKVREITDPAIVEAIQATCIGSTAIDSITLYDHNTEEFSQHSSNEMAAEDVDLFLHQDFSFTNKSINEEAQNDKFEEDFTML